MCGIFGFYGFNNRKLLKNMSKILFHRGPDQEGLYEEEKISLGNRRLSIIDLKRGKQPIFNEDKKIVVVYNGEIYNFKELKEELKKKGHKFKTNTDTEVIVHSYEEYGYECIKKFNGMFAFALWDKRKELLFIGRDRLGIKPLYYYFDKKKFLFASEIKAILEDKSIKRELNKETLIDYLAFQNIVDDKTFFKNIKLLLPGHYLVLNKKKTAIERYWDVDYEKTEDDNIENIVKKFKKIFSESVDRHLISDVSLGSFLSGGFDSGSVTLLSGESYKKRLPVFTGLFKEGGKYNPSKYSRAIARKIKGKIKESWITSKDFRENVEKVIYHLDEPRVGVAAVSMYMVSKLISENVKVVMTGEGGDEILLGYPVYKSALIQESIKKNPLSLLKIFSLFDKSEVFRGGYFLFYPLFQREVG
ncbi:asparagine synthase (glutamine-hydrolyzing), partial [Candidatus Pacearchaeota archaeon]|nr:asparagine synthase (glutamine-hydrolyzing) [Candidatus Pacearchaeota archaeon]